MSYEIGTNDVVGVTLTMWPRIKICQENVIYGYHENVISATTRNINKVILCNVK